jgi:membrane protease YdiL (CAAX protease family)
MARESGPTQDPHRTEGQADSFGSVPWRWWEAVPVFLLGIGATGLLAAPITDRNHPTTMQQLIDQVILEVAFAATVVLWLRIRHGDAVWALGVPRHPGRDVLAGFVGGLAMVVGLVYVVGLSLQNALEALSGHSVKVPKQLPGGLTDGKAVLAGVAVVVLAPIAEELFFRGMVFRGLRAELPFWSAAAISAVVFGAAHLSVAIPGPWTGAVLLVTVLALVGFGLAWIYERRRNIVSCMVAHATFNLLGFLVLVLVVR